MFTNPKTGRTLFFTSGETEETFPNDMSVAEYEARRVGVCETLSLGECPWWPVCETR